MVIKINDDFRKNGMRDGSNLKSDRGIGGIGAGMIALGICLVVIGSAIFCATMMADMLFAGIVVLVPCAVLGGFICAGGVILRAKQLNSYLDYYVKRTGYTKEELEDFERETLQEDTVILTDKKKLNKEACKSAGIVTTHWFKGPCFGYTLIKIADIAAIWHDNNGYYQGSARGPIIMIVRSNGTVEWFTADADLGQEVIAEIEKRNPVTITVRNFGYQGRQYDALKQQQEVAAIYRDEFKRQMSTF